MLKKNNYMLKKCKKNIKLLSTIKKLCSTFTIMGSKFLIFFSTGFSIHAKNACLIIEQQSPI